MKETTPSLEEATAISQESSNFEHALQLSFNTILLTLN
jgi:hypothetical protein